MKIIKNNLKESFSVYDIQNMISDDTLRENCDHWIEELRNIAFDIAQTDKLENFLTKYYRSAPAYIDLIRKCTEMLISAKKKG